MAVERQLEGRPRRQVGTDLPAEEAQRSRIRSRISADHRQSPANAELGKRWRAEREKEEGGSQKDETVRSRGSMLVSHTRPIGVTREGQ
jgi:hypothetical protein